ncbi:MAG: hypothetical protein JWO37_3830 [Acidimicrobiales bacterium]|jgi:hypothetical protein|nr:hypothetical protein [Acidimicrobiales bacterium]
METGRDRRALVAEAGYGRLSLSSVLAGALVGAGTFGILAVSAVAIAHRAGWHGQLADTPPGRLALAGGVVMAALLFVSFLYGGYVAGRMSRRAGLTHGIATFVLAVAGTVAAVAILVSIHGIDAVARMMHRADLPVTRNDWRSNTGLTIAVASAVAMFVGSVAGAIRGDHWHGRLVTRASDAEGPATGEIEDRVAPYTAANGPAVREGRDANGDRELSLEEERELAREKR